MNSSSFHLIPLTLILCFSQAAGQSHNDNNAFLDQLLHRADSLLARHSTSEARDLYRGVLRVDNNSVAAILGLGRAEMEAHAWTEAIDWFEQAAKRDTGNLEARYLMGRAYGLRGRGRLFLEKMFGGFTNNSFEKGRVALRWVIARDSAYKDAFLQIAQIYIYEREYAAAIPFAVKQIEVSPGLRPGHAGMYKVGHIAVAMHDESVPPKWLTYPMKSYNQLFEAEWERRKGSLNKAEQVLKELLQTPGIVRRPLILETLAKVKARQGDSAEVERLALMSIENIRTMGDADIIFEDIKHIITDEELSDYRALRTGTDAKRFFNVFWTKRNPYPAGESNARIAEHFRRIVYAEQWYEEFGSKTFSAETMPLDFPESYFLNEEFNDKGIIYLRHGEPHQTIRTSTIGSDPAESNESWVYRPTDEHPQMLFDFSVSSVGARINEWRLVPVLSHPGMWDDRMEYSKAYARLSMEYLRAHNARSSSQLGMASSLNDAVNEGREMVHTGVTSDHFSYAKEVQYYGSPISVTCFRGFNGRTLVNLGYIIAPAEIARAYPDSITQFEVAIEYSMYDATWKKAASSNKKGVYKRAKDFGDVMIENFWTAVKPDSYTVAWQARPVEGKQMFSDKLRAFVPDFTGTSLMLSDLELAIAIETATGASSFDHGSLSVVPNPAKRCLLNRPLYLYFEAYNLTKDRNGKTSYTIEYRLTSVEIEKSFLSRLLTTNKKTSIAVPSERSGSEDWSPEYIAIDVSSLEPGKYQLQVKLTDNVAKKSVLRSLEATIYQPQQ